MSNLKNNDYFLTLYQQSIMTTLLLLPVLHISSLLFLVCLQILVSCVQELPRSVFLVCPSSSLTLAPDFSLYHVPKCIKHKISHKFRTIQISLYIT